MDEKTWAKFGCIGEKDLGIAEEYIYVLVDQRDSTVRYVGRTNNPRTRLSAHGNESSGNSPEMKAWVRELKASGGFLVMKIVEKVTPERALGAEEEWIHRYSKVGRLFNSQESINRANELVASGKRRITKRRLFASMWDRRSPDEKESEDVNPIWIPV